MFKNLNMKKILGCFWLLILFFIFFYFKDYIIDLLDYIVGDLLKQILFPDVTTLLIILILINVMLIFVFKQKKLLIKIINLLFYLTITGSFVIIFYNVKIKNLDIYNKVLLYSDATILILVRIITISFLVLILLKIFRCIINNLMKKGIIEEKEYNTYLNTISQTVTIRSNQNNYEKLSKTEIISVDDIKQAINNEKLGKTELLPIEEIKEALANEKLGKTEIFSIDDIKQAINNEKLSNTETLSMDDIKEALKKEYN